MTELANTNAGGVTVLDSLAAQAQMCIASARMNLLQLGRVLTEAKPLVKHGEWEAWVSKNADMSARSAQQYMQAYARFGLNPDIAALGSSKLSKLLPLSDNEMETLFAENDVQEMSTRQLDEAIKQQKAKLKEEARAELQDEIDREREARIAAEQRAQAAESRPPEVPESVKMELKTANAKVKEQQERIDALSASEQSRYQEHQKALCENRRLQQEIRERDEIIEEQQADYNRAQEELLNVKSSIAKGDAERAPLDQFTPDVFAKAVRAFIGSCARMPHMKYAFSSMDEVEKREYDELLQTVESWAESSRQALDSVIIDGEGIVNE